VAVSDRDSFLTARRVTREEGILIGGSGGTAVWAALEVGRDLGPEHVVVVIIPDSGRGYLSKIYDDDWMSDYGFLSAAGQTAGDVLGRKAADMPALVHVHLGETVRDVIGILREFEVSQVPVVRTEPPLVSASEVAGSVAERELLERAFKDPSVLDLPVAGVMSPPLPTVGRGEPVDVVVAALDNATAVLVLDGGHPVGILTRTDLLTFLTGR
jgi:cystathionine beta-synthase